MTSSSKWTFLNTNSVIFPAGTYYIGDVSCAFENVDDYYDLEDLLAPAYTGFLQNGKHTVGICSLPGNGVYTDTKGREYGVEAGNFGILPVGLVTAKNVHCDCFGKVFNFQTEFEFGIEPYKYIWIRDRVNRAKSFEIIIEEDYYDYMCAKN